MNKFLHLLLGFAIVALVAGAARAVIPSGPGQTTSAHSVSVVFASDATMPSVTVTGGATSAKQDTGNTSLASIDTKLSTANTALDLLKQPTRTAAVTISDATDVTSTCTKGVWVGTGGNLAVKGAGDSSAVTHKNVPSGAYVPGAFSRIMSTNTTASDINCLYGP